MKLCFTGFTAPIELDSTAVNVLEIHNTSLFARVCSSLQQELGEDAVEPYSWWGSNGENIAPHNAALFIASPLELPWEERRLASSVVSAIEGFVQEDLAKRSEVEGLVVQLGKAISELSFLLSSNYSIDVDWDMKRCLKAFGFKAEVRSDELLFDKCINFLSYCSDSINDLVLVFVNLKTFLSENELLQLYEHAFFLNLKLLLIEQVAADVELEGERKYIIDQDLLESWSNC